MREIKLIVIKEYREFTADVNIEGVADHQNLEQEFIVAKEVEAIIQLDNDNQFSIGFSADRGNPLFYAPDPREMVKRFFQRNFE